MAALIKLINGSIDWAVKSAASMTRRISRQSSLAGSTYRLSCPFNVGNSANTLVAEKSMSPITRYSAQVHRIGQPTIEIYQKCVIQAINIYSSYLQALEIHIKSFTANWFLNVVGLLNRQANRRPALLRTIFQLQCLLILQFGFYQICWQSIWTGKVAGSLQHFYLLILFGRVLPDIVVKL